MAWPTYATTSSSAAALVQQHVAPSSNLFREGLQHERNLLTQVKLYKASMLVQYVSRIRRPLCIACKIPGIAATRTSWARWTSYEACLDFNVCSGVGHRGLLYTQNVSKQTKRV